MKYSSKQNRTTSTRMSHKSLIGVAVAAIVLVIGVVTALSMVSGQTQKAKVEEVKHQVTKQVSRNYVTRNADGQTVAVDRQTGQTRPLTPEEARRLADGIKQMASQSSEGLVQIRRANGSVSIDLQGRFQSVLLAKKEDDGTISQACIDNVESAAAFFEIDPELLGGDAPISKTPTSFKPVDR